MALKRAANNHLVWTSEMTCAPVDGELLVRPIIAGVCGTDLQIIAGMRNETAQILGHEGLVEVLEAPADETLVGRRFVVNPTSPRTGIAHLGHDRPGLWQQRLTIPSRWQDEDLLVAVPDALEPALGILVEPMAVALYALEIAEVSPRDRVLVIGSGTIATLLLKLLHSQECFLASGSMTREAEIASSTFDVAIVCTFRDRLENAVNLAVHGIRPFGTVDFITGPGSHWRSQHLAGVDIDAIRKSNTAGRTTSFPSEMDASALQKKFRIRGHRGAGVRHFKLAATMLSVEPETFRELVSVVPLSGETVELISRAIKQIRDRNYDRGWTKLGLDLSGDGHSFWRETA